MLKKVLICSAFISFIKVVVSNPLQLDVQQGEKIVFIGNGLGERMIYFPHFETELQRRYPDAKLIVRNMCRPGDTPGFRAHPSRETQWAFPGAEAFHSDKQFHDGIGHFPYPDEWLTTLQADTILAFFGYNESFDGMKGLENFTNEIDTFVTHNLAQQYNGEAAPRLVLISPIAFEDLSRNRELPDGKKENKRLKAYTEAVSYTHLTLPPKA